MDVLIMTSNTDWCFDTDSEYWLIFWYWHWILSDVLIVMLNTESVSDTWISHHSILTEAWVIWHCVCKLTCAWIAWLSILTATWALDSQYYFSDNLALHHWLLHNLTLSIEILMLHGQLESWLLLGLDNMTSVLTLLSLLIFTSSTSLSLLPVAWITLLSLLTVP